MTFMERVLVPRAAKMALHLPSRLIQRWATLKGSVATALQRLHVRAKAEGAWVWRKMSASVSFDSASTVLGGGSSPSSEDIRKWGEGARWRNKSRQRNGPH